MCNASRASWRRTFRPGRRSAVSSFATSSRCARCPTTWRFFSANARHLGGQRRRDVQRIARAYEELVEGIFRAGVAGGEFAADLDCRLAALGLLGMCNWVPTWYARNRGHTLEQIAEQFAAIFLEGLKA